MHKLDPIRNMHHVAYRCRDAEQTRWFYEDVLGLRLRAALEFTEISGTAVQREYMHLFFEMSDGSFVAFFDDPEHAEAAKFAHADGLDRHLALEAANEVQQAEWKQRLKAHGIKCIGPIDHDFVKSIYCYDPNGLQVELTVRSERHDTILDHKEAIAREQIRSWSEKTRARKLALFGEQELDRREVPNWT